MGIFDMPRIVLAAILAAALGVGAAAAKDGLSDDRSETSTLGETGGAKYITPDGYVVLAVDDAGRVEGYYEKNGAFGEIHGRLHGDRLRGWWVSSETAGPACAHPLREQDRWGSLTLTFDSADSFLGFADHCDDESVGALWSGTRL